MVTTANTNYDAQLTSLGTAWGLSNNQVFDRLVLQASQRMGGGGFSASPGPQVANPATGANGSVFTTPGNPAATNVRLGVGND